jgi:hypothetical protein
LFLTICVLEELKYVVLGVPCSRKKHIRNLVWGNETEDTARRVSSRQL